MSSLAAARADNFYYAPDFNPDVHKSLNKYNGQHPLRERAKKLDQGILVIRFEMPFNVWCNGCGHLIGKGVRFNAEKKAIGNYYSTKIWSFCMTSPCCQEHIEVQTDPKNHEYIVVAGARRKAESYTAADAETMELPDKEEEGAQAQPDPFARLEKGVEDRRRGREGAERIAELREDSSAKYKDDYTINKALRRQLRTTRKAEKGRDEKRKQLGLSESVKLLPESDRDAQAASMVAFGSSSSYLNNRKHQRTAIKTQSIFHLGATKHLPSSQAQVQQAKSSMKARAGLQSSSMLDKAALLHKRRRMDSGLQLALSDVHGRTAA
ncbi:g6748 [Coccomyxa viridis]|uniref:G6748 protein n=1 Tax=Coccomyxa viridis TaxID=1274662 RepID=A0ABP1FW55_9CHLO